jgi:sacsin
MRPHLAPIVTSLGSPLRTRFTFNDLLSKTIDVQGFSHQSRKKLDSCHAAMPKKPIFMSECCSCNTMRDEDEGTETTHDNPHHTGIEKSFNARCAESNDATNASDGVDYGK